MTPAAAETTRDLELALALADAADQIALRRFRARDLAVERKPDASPVTDADRAIERLLRDRLSDARPGDAVIGEEGGASGRSDRVWYLDPIDGTSRYVAGDTTWFVLIALAVAGEAVIGVASAPARGTRWWAGKGAGAFRDGSRLRVSRTAELAAATLSDDWHATLADKTRDHPLARLSEACGRVRPHDGYSHLAVAEGAADLALEAVGHAWDFAPTKVIVHEAGGRFTDLRGRDAFDGGDSLVSNGALHAQALAALHAADRS